MFNIIAVNRCPLARLSVLHNSLINMGHNGLRMKMYGVVMILMENVHAGGQSKLGHLSLLHYLVNIRALL